MPKELVEGRETTIGDGRTLEQGADGLTVAPGQDVA